VGGAANVQVDKDFLKFACGAQVRYHNCLDAEKKESLVPMEQR